MEAAVSSQRKPASRTRQRPFRLKEEQLRSYLNTLQEDGRAKNTLQKYRTALNQFYDSLGPDKWVYAHSLPQWKQSLLDGGYAERSINASMVAVNGLYEYLGCWEWQHREWLELKAPDGPELSRQEYLLLLERARQQENIQLYLLVKILGTTDLTPGDMPLLTREAVNAGWVSGKSRGTREEKLVLPEFLREDLLEYALQHGIRSGPILLGSGGKCLERTLISRQISQLGEDAGLPPGKANPRNLRKLHLNTLEGYRTQAEAWVRSSYDALLDREESAVAWRRHPQKTESYRQAAGE